MSGKPGIGVGIVGMGASFPEHLRTNDWWDADFGPRQGESLDEDIVAGTSQRAARGEGGLDPAIARLAAAYATDPFRGARERYVVADGETSSDLECRAAQLALQDAQLGPADVDLLITFSQIPDYACPGNHALVAHKLGLAQSTASMTVSTDCASFVPQLAVASRLIQSGEYRTAVIVQGSATSLAIDWTQPSSTGVGDGAVATVLRPISEGYGYVGSHLATLGEYHASVRIAPKEAADTPWYRGSAHASDLVFQSMDRQRTTQLTDRQVSMATEACASLLRGAGWSTADVAFFLCSQPTEWFGIACCETMGIPKEHTLNTFARYGHLMPASLPVNLWTAYRDGRLHEGDLVLGYTQGPGFIQAAMLYRWLPPRHSTR